ncbi:MAG: hypothetical protein Q4E28_01755 [Clostridia bacterium]|nr:hypothetical protein [Clostridia bacterium]
MKKFVKPIALILVVFSFLFLFSCNKDGKQKTNRPSVFEKKREIRLPYSKQDGLNPYFAKTRINYNLFPLMYESLVKLDSDYSANKVLAKNIENKGYYLDVQVDGKKFSPYDVVYSFYMAKRSPLYAPTLVNVDKAMAYNGDTVRFTLIKPRKFAENALTFPIVKSKTADRKENLPEGTGMYSLSNDNLVKNRNSSEKPLTEKISLFDINKDSALYYGMQVGNLDAYYDPLISGNLKTSPTQRAAISTTNLVALTFGPRLSITPDQKKYISYSIDREKFKNEGFSGHLNASNLPYHKGIPEVCKFYKKQGTPNELKDKIGNFTDKEYSLIYCNDNTVKANSGTVIAKQLLNSGIKIKAEALSYSEYMSRLKSGRYDFALVEIKLTQEIDLTPVISDKNFLNIYESFERKTISTEAFIKAYYDNLPFITLGYKNGVLVYSRQIKENISANETNVYDGFNNWYITENK